MRAVLLLSLASLALACTGDAPGAGDDDDGPDGGGGPGAADAGPPDAAPAPPDAGCAPLPAASPPWLASYQQDLVARLSGETDLTPGVRLQDRASSTRRGLTRDFLAAQLGALGLAAERQAYGSGENVYAVLAPPPGSSEVVVLGAHFDTVFGSPGANDNATGLALVLATARTLKEVDCRTRGAIFVFFDQEEIGLVGSEAFASWLASSSGYTVVSVHTVDQMGWDEDDNRAIELELPADALLAAYADATMTSMFDIPLYETNTSSTDHVSFHPYGFPSVGLTEQYVTGDTTPCYHQSCDTYDTVDFGYLGSSSALVAYLLMRVVSED